MLKIIAPALFIHLLVSPANAEVLKLKRQVEAILAPAFTIGQPTTIIDKMCDVYIAEQTCEQSF